MTLNELVEHFFGLPDKISYFDKENNIEDYVEKDSVDDYNYFFDYYEDSKVANWIYYKDDNKLYVELSEVN